MPSPALARHESSFRRVLRSLESFSGLVAVAAVSAIAALRGAAHAGLTDQFAIGVNQIVTNGQPVPGAGNLEGPGAIDIYTFTVDPGTEILFNGFATSNCNIRWTLKDDQETVLFDQALTCGADPGPLTLDGTYTITVYFDGDNAGGSYSFILVTEDLYDYFSIGLNQIVSTGMPAPGAGVLEGRGERDIYTFTVDPGTEILFNGFATSNCNIRWTLKDDQETVLFDQALTCGADPGPLTLDGTYTITVYFDGENAGGSYGFILCWTESPDLNCDGAINGADLGILLGAWGPCNDCSGDFNGDSVIDGADLGVLLGAWVG